MSDGGKGDKRRPTDEEKYRSNYDLIFNKNKFPNTVETHACYCCNTECSKIGRCLNQDKPLEPLDKSKQE